ncbi:MULTISPECIES: hypothetical protein [Actinosynnema]|uniref:hypothetical protein n=1 Tax=Actinosynnema TaxID=40566 RepID=UPI0020A3E4CD|nr:hypothetical protein [Actinosynnema pretiosum]
MPTEQPEQDVRSDTPFREHLALAKRCSAEVGATAPPFNPEPFLEDLARELVLGGGGPAEALALVVRRAGVGVAGSEDVDRWRDTVIEVLNRTGLVAADREGVDFRDRDLVDFFAGRDLARDYPDPAAWGARGQLAPRKFRSERHRAARIALAAHWQDQGHDLTKAFRRLLRPWWRGMGVGVLGEMNRYGVVLERPLVVEAVTYLKRRLSLPISPELNRRVGELYALTPGEAVDFLGAEVRRRGAAGPKRAAFALHLLELDREGGRPALVAFMVDPLVKGYREEFWNKAHDRDRRFALTLLDLALADAEDGDVRNALAGFLEAHDLDGALQVYAKNARDRRHGEEARLHAAKRLLPHRRADAVEVLFEHLKQFGQRATRKSVMRLLLDLQRERLNAELVRFHRNAANPAILRFDAAHFCHLNLQGPPEPLIDIAHLNPLGLDEALIAVKANPGDRRVVDVCDELVHRHKPSRSPDVLTTIKRIEEECLRATAVKVVRYYTWLLDDGEWDYDIRKRAFALAKDKLTGADATRFCRVLFDDPRATPHDKLEYAEAAQKNGRAMGVVLFREFIRMDVSDEIRLVAAEKVDDRQACFDLCERVAEAGVEPGGDKRLRSALALAYETDQGKAVDLAARVLRDRPAVDHGPLLRDFKSRDRQEVLRRLAPPEKSNPA